MAGSGRDGWLSREMGNREMVGLVKSCKAKLLACLLAMTFYMHGLVFRHLSNSRHFK
jgi:hypothetical protein